LKIIVIGGAGFIGSRLVPKLVDLGHDVAVFDKQAQDSAHDKLEYIQGNICDLSALSSAMKGRDLVYNLAAEHQDNVEPLSLYTDVNVDGATNVVTAARENKVSRIIFTSSVAIYGSQQFPMAEDTPTDYFNEYGRTKYLAELEFEKWLEQDAGAQLTVVRPTVVFGPGNRGNVYNFLRQLKHGPFLMFGDGRNIKSVAHVENVSSFLAFLSQKAERHGVYNYSDTPDLEVRDMVKLVDVALGRGEGYRFSFPKPLGIMAGMAADIVAKLIKKKLPVSAIRVEKFCSPSHVDANKAMSTGFEPVISVEDSLKEMVVDHV